MVFDFDKIFESPETKYNTFVLKILIDFYLTSMRPEVLRHRAGQRSCSL